MMTEITTAHYVALSAVIFAVGLFGVVTRRNLVIIIMSLELMFNASILAFVAFDRHWGLLDGQMMAFFIIAVAAAEAAVALALIIALMRIRGNVTVDEITELKG